MAKTKHGGSGGIEYSDFYIALGIKLKERCIILFVSCHDANISSDDVDRSSDF